MVFPKKSQLQTPQVTPWYIRRRSMSWRRGRWCLVLTDGLVTAWRKRRETVENPRENAWMVGQLPCSFGKCGTIFMMNFIMWQFYWGPCGNTMIKHEMQVILWQVYWICFFHGENRGMKINRWILECLRQKFDRRDNFTRKKVDLNV